MLTVGDQFPSFKATAVVAQDPNKAFEQVTDQSYPGKWKVEFFWPKDFTFVCPTEIAAFGKLTGDFADRDTQLLGVSIDSEYVHLAWRGRSRWSPISSASSPAHSACWTSTKVSRCAPRSS